jgi:hypothetical protein
LTLGSNDIKGGEFARGWQFLGPIAGTCDFLYAVEAHAIRNACGVYKFANNIEKCALSYPNFPRTASSACAAVFHSSSVIRGIAKKAKK